MDEKLNEEHSEKIDYEEKFDIVGISFYSMLAADAYRIADTFRKKGVHVALGGIHATLVPDEAGAHADTVFIGEAEETWPRFVRDFQEGKTKARYECISKPDLKKSVIPRWDLVKNRFYLMQQVQTTRGCLNDCSFCSVSQLLGRPRYKPVENVVREIEEIKRNNKNPFIPVNITFSDDDIVSNKAHAKALFEAITPLNIRWSSQSSVLIARDEELLALAKKSGCDLLLIGFESVSQAALDEIDKGRLNRVSEFSRAIEKIQSYGISILLGIIYGFDDDDTSIFRRTTDFLKESGAEFPMFNIMTPNIGTRLTKRLESEGRMLPFEWQDLDSYHVCFKPKKLTEEELIRGHRESIVDIYSAQAILDRIKKAYCRGGIVTPSQSGILGLILRSYVCVKLVIEAFSKDRELRGFILKMVKEIVMKPAIKINAILMFIDRYEFSIRLARCGGHISKLE
ncbi:MAG: radical SAM protein [Oligoflexales bacterium]|nr:radical SAM protein [Oligoflexales bacterium]